MAPKKRSWFSRLFGSHNSPSDLGSSDSSVDSFSAPGTPAPGPEDPPVPLSGLDLHQSTAMIRHIVRALNDLGYGANPTPEVVYFSKPEDIEKPLKYVGRTPGPYGGRLPAPDDGEGSLMGLENITKQVASAEDFARDMPEMVNNFVSSLISSIQITRDMDSIPDAEFYSYLRVRLTAIELLPESAQADAFEFNPESPIRPFSDALCIHLVVDSPNAVLGLTPDSLEDRGPVEDLFRIGYRNLWQDLIDSDLEVQSIQADKSKPGERVWLFVGSSYYVGSIPILLDDIVERYLPQIDRESGLLLAAPYRHVTLLREMDEGSDLMGSIKMMATLAANQFSQQAGALSPRLMISHMGEVTTFTNVKWNSDHTAELEVKPTAYLTEKLHLGDLGDGGGLA